MFSAIAIGITGGGRFSTVILVVACLLMGLHFIVKGIRNDIIDATGIEKAPRWLYFVGGIALELPAVFYIFYLRSRV